PIRMGQPPVMHTSENTKSTKEKISFINDINDEAQYERPLSRQNAIRTTITCKKKCQLVCTQAKHLMHQKKKTTNTGANSEPRSSIQMTQQLLSVRSMYISKNTESTKEKTTPLTPAPMTKPNTNSTTATINDEAQYERPLSVKKKKESQLVCTQAKHLMHQEKMTLLTPAPTENPVRTTQQPFKKAQKTNALLMTALRGSPVQTTQQLTSQLPVMHTSENTKNTKEKIGSINDGISDDL
ncbi:11490_t:CDS:2, partial [Gigaspora margarita]